MDVGGSVDALLGRDPARMSHDERLDWLADLQRAASRIDAATMRGLAAVQLDPPPRPTQAESRRRQWAREEVAVRLGWSHRTTGERMTLEGRLVDRFPATAAALEAGRPARRHAETLVHGTEPLILQLERPDHPDSDPPAQVRRLLAAIERRVLPRAATQTPWRFARTVEAAVAEIDPVGEDDRFLRSMRSRVVSVTPACSGMSEVYGHLPAVDGATVRAALEAVADRLADHDRRQAGGSGDRDVLRTREQLRADALVAICAAALHDGLVDATVGPLASGQGMRPAVQLTVAASTLLSDKPAPGILEGYGHLPISATLTLLADRTGSWRRLLTDDAGRLTAVGRATYRPPAALRDLVLERDRRCRFPGCERTARRGEIDHARPWHAGGHTDAANLVAVCARHHRLKHRAGWSVSVRPDGTVCWTSPQGWRLTDPADELPRDLTTRPGGRTRELAVPDGAQSDAAGRSSRPPLPADPPF